MATTHRSQVALATVCAALVVNAFAPQRIDPATARTAIADITKEYTAAFGKSEHSHDSSRDC